MIYFTYHIPISNQPVTIPVKLAPLMQQPVLPAPQEISEQFLPVHVPVMQGIMIIQLLSVLVNFLKSCKI